MTEPIYTRRASKSRAIGYLAGLAGLFFLSGVGGLMLQVLWMYRLGLVFGNAAYATAATLSAFFLGLALGGWLLGRSAGGVKNSLATYGLLEIGVALSALLWLSGLNLYEAHYSTVTAVLGPSRQAMIAAKFLLAVSLLLIPTFLMGGTFPVLTHHLVRARRQLGRRGSFFYAVNTMGAALGALLTGFYLLPALGVRDTYLLAVGLLGAVGVVTLGVAWKGAPSLEAAESSGAPPKLAESATPTPDLEQPAPARDTADPTTPEGGATVADSMIIALAAASGFLTLSAETLWTRMFAQVLQNSVYSFSAILVVFLVALGVGGIVAHGLARTSASPRTILAGLLVSGALLVGLSPTLFHWATAGLAYIAPRATWGAYLVAVFRIVVLVILPPAVLIGAVFPYLLKATPDTTRETGELVGRLVLFNSIGAVAGPLIAGFFLLDAIGLWGSLKMLALLYGALALVLAFPMGGRRARWWVGVPAVGLVILTVLPAPPIVRLEPGDVLRETLQGSDGVVAVVENGGNLQMRLDNYYALGDSRSALVEQMQAHVPLLIHPRPDSILFLGMGTGLTAAAALIHDPKRVVVAELVPNVITAARRHFSPWNASLFTDDRVKIVADDARNFLLGSTARFDVIVGDLFTPWHAGTGSLYTVEHFRLVREHLAPDGVFAQWLPLYQLTPREFEIIAATFSSVFPQVTVWRADFSDSRASVALVGQEAGAHLSEEVLRANSAKLIGNGDTETPLEDHMTTLFYVGNLTAAPDDFSGVALNTDERRTVELSAPVSSQEAGAGRKSFIVQDEMERLLGGIRKGVAVQEDPYLELLPPGEKRYAEAGFMYFRYLRMVAAGRRAEASELLQQIDSISPGFGMRVAASRSGTGDKAEGGEE
ncbi:MAG: fused MFS/spermidine synthase [Gemmatimonadota bacterium]